MKECDILGVKAYSDPSYIFSGVQDPNLQDLRSYAGDSAAAKRLSVADE